MATSPSARRGSFTRREERGDARAEPATKLVSRRWTVLAVLDQLAARKRREQLFRAREKLRAREAVVLIARDHVDGSREACELLGAGEHWHAHVHVERTKRVVEVREPVVLERGQKIARKASESRIG